MKFRSVIEQVDGLARHSLPDLPFEQSVIHKKILQIGAILADKNDPLQWLRDHNAVDRIEKWIDDHPKAAGAIREIISDIRDDLPWCHDDGLSFDYESVTASEVILTGVRASGWFNDDVVVTGSAVSDSVTGAALYEGSLADLASASSDEWHILTPDFEGQTVSSATFYGPNTAIFDPDLGVGNIRAVGSYKYAEADAPNADHGMIYEGPVEGGGTGTQIDATDLVAPGDTLINTIAHSNMGDLVVGNYDTRLATGHAFIYNIEEDTWVDLNPADSLSVTAYGIWQNGGPESTSYTIAGGYSDLDSLGLDAGYLLDYDSKTNTITNFTTFQYDGQPLKSLISHFDGITGTKDGYHLTGDFVDVDGPGAFFAEVERKPDGSFSDARWSEIAFPGDDVTATSGNTVVDDTVLGVYVEDSAVTSFVATANPSHGWDLLG
ncbi:hypothetical protein [Gymnodinialimonas sp.]